MPLFPQAFIDDLKSHADIVLVIQDYVSLKKTGATYKGLCPFHGEKTPSFHVNRDKGFFHCFGCGVGGDVFKFLELHEKVGFQDAVTQLAQRFGLTLPEMEASEDGRQNAQDREALLKAHEAAAAYFREQLASPAGARIRRQLQERAITPETAEKLGLGFAPATREGLKAHLMKAGLSLPVVLRSGLVVEREDGSVVDRFRNRLMIPICRDTGSVIAFGGRAVESDQQPKYLNSPETPIYVKSRTLYGLHLSKGAIRQRGFVVLVEGYFDFAQVMQAGILPVVASCGTALTSQQAQLLRRFTSKVVLSFDPDAAGQGATERSCEMLVAEGFEVNVAVLPHGQDPDAFVRKEGGSGYAERLRTSRPYLEFLLDRSAAAADLASDEGRRHFLGKMLGVAARIPDAAARDQFADRLAHKARITEEVVRAEIRKAAVQKKTQVTVRELPSTGPVKKVERALIWALIHSPGEAVAALGQLEPADVEGLNSRGILRAAMTLAREGADVASALLERLSTAEAELVTEIASQPSAPALDLGACAREVRRLRHERELTEVQRRVAEMQDRSGSDDEMTALLTRRGQLARLIAELR